MATRLLLAVACLAGAAWAQAPPVLSSPIPRLEDVYAHKLQAKEYFTVSGYIAPERFAPVPKPEIELVLTLAGVQRLSTRVLPDNSWAFKLVPPGTHVLEVIATGARRRAPSRVGGASPTPRAPSLRPPGYEVPTLRVDVSQAGAVRFSRVEAPQIALRKPLVLSPHALQLYADPVSGWSLRSLMQNPMVRVEHFDASRISLTPRAFQCAPSLQYLIMVRGAAQNFFPCLQLSC